MKPMSQETKKIYCYVDETGQDTMGTLFLVSIIVAEGEHDSLREKLQEIEHASGKGMRKWMKTRPKQKVNYIRKVLKIPEFKGKLCYAVYRGETDYLSSTVLATAQAIKTHVTTDYRAVVFVDGLPKSQVHWFGTELRHMRVNIDKVRGVRREEADSLMRLADALCGFVRQTKEGSNKELKELLERGLAKGYLREV